MGDHVRAATVVTGTGEVLRLGNRARKSASGYHLLGLVVGSEGTLAVVTELTLALAGLPQARRQGGDRKSTRLNSSHTVISYAVFCLKKKNSSGVDRGRLLTNRGLILYLEMNLLRDHTN